MTRDPDVAFARAQREWDARTPPEGPEPCRWHPWNEDELGPMPDECPECEAAAEDYREGMEDERRAEARRG